MAQEFSCCAFYMKCDYGRNECFFAESQPEKKERCRCYKLKHEQPRDYETSKGMIQPIEVEEPKENVLGEQLSLF